MSGTYLIIDPNEWFVLDTCEEKDLAEIESEYKDVHYIVARQVREVNAPFKTIVNWDENTYTDSLGTYEIGDGDQLLGTLYAYHKPFIEIGTRKPKGECLDYLLEDQ